MANALSIESWYSIIYEVFVMKGNIFSMRLQKHIFEELWKKWKMYISWKHPSFV